ncbi:MAG: choice-of-anchor tandem repeat GloVer-containing protein [Candidatus Korobacteraceae bacterium]
MHSRGQHFISLFRAIIRAAVTALLITLVALPVAAQSSVPASAVQAAKLSQFAQRLAHPASPPNPAPVHQASRPGPPQSDLIYENGPINGNTDAWNINYGSVISDTFTTNGTQVTGMTFAAWLYPNDTMYFAEVSITAEPNGGQTYFDQVVTFTQGPCTYNQLGYNICTETSANFTSLELEPGTYWVNVQNASITNDDPAFWDENSGVGCMSSGCPSQAEANYVGTIPSESFTLLGNNDPAPQCFKSQDNLQIISNFTQMQAGTSGQNGVVVDRAGNVYGTFPNGGSNSAGLAFKLSDRSGWILDPLYNFAGGSSGGQPTGLIVGPNGSLYGGAQGGIQNCGTGGSQYCGVVFNLTPPPTACKTALCYWSEKPIYQFSSEADGAGIVNLTAYDQQGNLYGTTTAGGANDYGTVFELSPSGGGWTKTILYNFSPGEVSSPIQVLVGNDGNLFGLTGSSLYQDGVLFQLVPSGGQWTLKELHWFAQKDGIAVSSLVLDSTGNNLYGILPTSGTIFLMARSGTGWSFYSTSPEGAYYLNGLTIDANDIVYGTASSASNQQNAFFYKGWPTNGFLNIQPLYYLGYEYFPTGGSLAVDANGNLYGTTSPCGTYNSGTVWQFAP